MVADNRGEHIVIYNRKEHMIKLLKQNIATPYIRYGGNPSSPAEIGYCVVNNNNEVKSIHIIRKDIQTFIFIQWHFYFSSNKRQSISFLVNILLI